MPMLPEIRRAYLAALEALRAAGQEAKPLYHVSRDVDSLVSQPKILSGMGNESWKPDAIYASDNLADNMYSTLGESGNLRTIVNSQSMMRDGKGGYVRIVPKPNATTTPIDEGDLATRLGMDQQWDRGADTPAKDPNIHSPEGDILKILNADGEDGLTEYLIRNPKAVNIFSDKKAWLPALATAMFGVGRASDADAMRIPGIPIPKRSATDILTKYFRTPDAAGSKPLEYLIDGAEGLKPKVDDIDSYVKSIVTSALKDAPEAPVTSLIKSAQFNSIPMDVMKAATKRTSALTDLDRYVSPDAWQEIKKFAGIPAVAGMVGLGTASDAEAGPRAQAIREALQGVLYHGTILPKNLRKQGLSPSQLSTDMGGDGAASFFTDVPDLAGAYAIPGAKATSGSTIIPARLTHDARVKVLREQPDMYGEGGVGIMSPEEAQAFRDSGYDAATIMPRGGRNGLGSSFLNSEIAVLNPSKLTSPWGVGGITAGVLGLGAAPDADAFPLGKLTQVTPRIAGKMMTTMVRSENAFDSLVGHEFTNVTFPGRKHPGDYEVVDVLKHPKNDWRFVQMEDAEGNLFQLPMTKDYLHTLLSAKGMKDYSEVFKDLGAQGRDYQATKSLSIREAKRVNTSDITNSKLHAYEASQADKVNEIDPKLLHDYLWARTPGSEKLDLMVPKDYATHLLKRGYDLQPRSQAYNPNNPELKRCTTNPIIPPRKGRPKS